MNRNARTCTTLLVLITVLFTFATSPVKALPADSMWIDPPVLDLNYRPIGFLFNVTVWLNVSTAIHDWQFYLTYPEEFLNATVCGYTGDGKSLWSRDMPTFQVEAGFGSYQTYGYVVHSETLKGNSTTCGLGSLSWVEFNLTKVADHSLFGQIRLDVNGTFASMAHVLDGNLTEIPLAFGLVEIVPEFPLTSMLAVFFLVTSCVIALRKYRRKDMQV
jgi:hypothetical protein